jgi:phosphinothricin acetyltransferase
VAVYNPYVTDTAVTFETVPVRPEDRAAWLDAHLSGGRHRIVVAEDADRQLVGWATTSPFRARAAYSTTVESSVYCAPGSVGQGIGSRLYEVLFRSIQGEDVERIVAGVTLPNPASIALHRHFGFQPVGVFTRVGRKLGRYWDVAWFERPLRIHRAEREGRGVRQVRPRHSIETSERM